MNKKVTVHAEHTYDVVFSNFSADLIEPIIGDARKIAVVVPSELIHLGETIQDQLKKLHGIEKVLIIEVPEGESQKNIATLSACWARLGMENFRRGDLIVGVGGGATTDLAGFVAATWLRGISWIAVPTSLAGMVDAAVGGKTGINSDAGKNLVGAFYSPKLVVIDFAYLKTLPEEELRAGMAEVIKCGFISDQRILEIIETNEDFYECESDSMKELIERAIAVKAAVVSQDLRESFLREILNYGHTLAHAIERHENYLWRHGDAVAIGMAFIANLALEVGLSSQSLRDRHLEILTRAQLPTRYPAKAWPDLLANMQIDKKSRGSGVRFVALSDNYEVVRLEGIADDVLQRAYETIST
jgi:3-dehydroquinate synthase